MTTIRLMTSEDIPAIAGWMVSDAHWQQYGMTAASISHDLQAGLDRDDLLLTAEREGQPVAFAWVIANGMFGAAPYLKRIGVDPNVTGHAIGSALMGEVERRVATTGNRHLYLLVGSRNPRAERFYQRRGYVRLATFPDFAVMGIDEFLYRKDLDALSY